MAVLDGNRPVAMLPVDWIGVTRSARLARWTSLFGVPAELEKSKKPVPSLLQAASAKLMRFGEHDHRHVRNWARLHLRRCVYIIKNFLGSARRRKKD
jgi:hypothetical protein